jgi:hypothetical protein
VPTYHPSRSGIIELMPIPLSAPTRKKLILAKQLYRRAFRHATTLHSKLDGLLAVVIFDLAIETVLKGVVASLTTQKTPTDSFAGLIQQAEHLMGEKQLGNLLDKAHINYVHEIRNGVQHKASYPNDSDLGDCRTYARDFLYGITRQIWDVEFDELSMVDLIRHDGVSNLMSKAESALDRGDTIEAAKHAAHGLQVALDQTSVVVAGRHSPMTRAIIVEEAFKKTKSDTRLFRSILRLRDTVLYNSLGMDYALFLRFRALVGKPIFTIDGKVHFPTMREAIEPEEAAFVVAYAIDTVVQIEEIVGDLNSPFGLDTRHSP